MLIFLEGVIVKIASEFCHVKTGEGEVIPCKARGLFKKKGYKPLVGDRVKFKKAAQDLGYIEEILERSNELKRPNISNVDQVVIVVATKEPRTSYKLLDRLLVLSYFSGLTSLVCVNKIELDEQIGKEISKKYHKIGYDTLTTSAKEKNGLDYLLKLLHNKTSVLAGASGVGKSSLINAINPQFSLKTDKVSRKTGRGKHTTRHVALFELAENTYVADTPGFSKLSFEGIDYRILDRSFPDMYEYAIECKFNDCLHDREPGCRVKEAVGKDIFKDRYENYLEFLYELKKGAAYNG